MLSIPPAVGSGWVNVTSTVSGGGGDGLLPRESPDEGLVVIMGVPSVSTPSQIAAWYGMVEAGSQTIKGEFDAKKNVW